MTTTVRTRASDIYKDWHVIDAAGRPLGRVASEAATLLRGKHKPTFERHLDVGDFVIIVNAAKVRVSGRKENQIKYYTHSGYPGGLKVRSFTEQLERFPERVIEQAVWGMLPDGPLGRKMLKHLKVYRGPDHPHASQIAYTEKSRAARAEQQAAQVTAPRKAPRLRPLPVPQEAAAGPKAAPRAAAATTAAAALEASTDTVLAAEAPVPEAAAVNEETVVAENLTPAEAAIEQAEPIAEEKPKRTRRSATATANEEAEPTARAPRARRAKAEVEAPAAEGATEKKPARQRSTKSEE